MATEKRHLTHTGIYAGRPICGAAERTGSDVHATCAPLDKDEFRATVCDACLDEYVASYDEDEIPKAPAWVRERIEQAKKSEQGQQSGDLF